MVNKPIISSTGKAIMINPLNTSPTNTSGKNINENNIFVIPHVALNAKNSILPKIIIIKIVNNKFNNCFLPPLVQFVSHETSIYLPIPVFH